MTEVERLYQSFDGPIPKHRLEAAIRMDEERERNGCTECTRTVNFSVYGEKESKDES